MAFSPSMLPTPFPSVPVLLDTSSILGFQEACGYLSFVSSFSIVLTGIVFRSMMSKIFMRIIFMISLCDLLGSSFLLVGFPGHFDPLCIAQGAFYIFFYRCSYFWTVILSAQLYSLVVYDKYALSDFAMHSMCWGVTIVLELIPFAFSNGQPAYGQDDLASGFLWCEISIKSDGSSTETALTYLLNFSLFCIPIFICYFILIGFIIKIRYFAGNVAHELSEVKLKSVINTQLSYTLAMIICWTPYVLCGTFINGVCIFNPNECTNRFSQLNTSIAIFNGFGALYGTGVAAIFFYSSREARQRWAGVFRCHWQSAATDELVVSIDFSELGNYELNNRSTYVENMRSFISTGPLASLDHNSTRSTISGF